MIFKIRAFGLVGSAAAVLSIVFTSLILFYLWSWLNPVDFWQKLVALIISAISGIVLFFIILAALLVILVFIFRPFIPKKRKAKREEDFRIMYE